MEGTEQPRLQKYLVKSRLANQAGDQVWLPGSAIELDDVRAQILLRAGVIEAINDTVAPDLAPTPTAEVHSAPEEPAATDNTGSKKKGKGE